MLLAIDRQDDVCILRIDGRFPSGTDPEYLSSKSDEVKALNCQKLMVDLREVPSIGSTGIGFLVGIYTSITKNPDGRFVMVGASPRVREVLDLTRLSSVLPLAPDPTAGLAVLHK
jgi:anti-anti-sigma factor